MKINKDKLWNLVPVAFAILALGAILFFALFADKKIKPEDMYNGNVTVTENTKRESLSSEKFEFVRVVPGTKNCVEYSGNAGGRLYICFSPFGGVCKIKIGSDGSQNLFVDSHNGYKQEIVRNKNGMLSKKKIQQDVFGIILSTPLVFEEECLQYLKEFPEEVQRAVWQTLLSLKT